MLGDRVCKFDGAAWGVVTDSGDLDDFPHFIADDQIYAKYGASICKWDGTAWSLVTDEPGEPLGPCFHFVSEDQIYGVVGQAIGKWS